MNNNIFFSPEFQAACNSANRFADQMSELTKNLKNSESYNRIQEISSKIHQNTINDTPYPRVIDSIQSTSELIKIATESTPAINAISATMNQIALQNQIFTDNTFALYCKSSMAQLSAMVASLPLEIRSYQSDSLDSLNDELFESTKDFLESVPEEVKNEIPEELSMSEKPSKPNVEKIFDYIVRAIAIVELVTGMSAQIDSASTNRYLQQIDHTTTAIHTELTDYQKENLKKQDELISGQIEIIDNQEELIAIEKEQLEIERKKQESSE